MKHALETFVGRGKSGDLYYDTACGVRMRFPQDSEVNEDAPVDDGQGKGWCPTCHPDKVVARLADEDGNTVALHPELGELQQDGDGTVMSEDRGEETVILEEVVEE